MQKKSLCADDLQLKTIEKYSPMVYRLAYSLMKSRDDADDIHQEVFIRYIGKQPVFENEVHEKAWFIRVTTNLCKNWWKSAWRQKVVNLSEYEEHGDSRINDKKYKGQCDDEYDACGGVIDDLNDNPVISAVKTLPTKYRVVIHLFYYEEMSIEEMAKALSLKPSTVRTQLTRAREKLGKVLKEEI